MTLLLLAACTDPVPEETAPVGDTGELGWWYTPPENAAQADWAVEDVTENWQAVLDGYLPTCNAVIENWLRYFAMSEGGSCLGVTPGDLNDGVGCTTPNDVWVRGQADYRYELLTETTFEHVINVDLDMVWPAGDIVRFMGSCGVNGTLTEPGLRSQSFEGTYLDPTYDGPMSEGISGMWWSHVTREADGSEGLYFTGGMGYGEHFLYFTELRAYADGCTSGIAQIRDPSGYWWAIDFGDGSREEGTCDSCGELSLSGSPVGQACLDWSTLAHTQGEQLWNQDPWFPPEESDTGSNDTGGP